MPCDLGSEIVADHIPGHLNRLHLTAYRRRDTVRRSDNRRPVCRKNRTPAKKTCIESRHKLIPDPVCNNQRGEIFDCPNPCNDLAGFAAKVCRNTEQLGTCFQLFPRDFREPEVKADLYADFQPIQRKNSVPIPGFK